MIHVLRKVRDRIAAPERWCQGESAYNQLRQPVHSRSPDACCWCLLGALNCEVSTVTESFEIMQFLTKKLGCHPATFNDDHPHGAVLGELDRVIQELENAGSLETSS